MHLNAAEPLLTKSVHVNNKGPEYNGRIELQEAAGGGFLDVVKLLILSSSLTDVNAEPSGECTALQAAAEGGHLDVVELPISEVTNVNSIPMDYGGRTALYAAAGKDI